jgi:hypothetical protein
MGHKRTHALQQVGEIQGEKFRYTARSTRMSIWLGSVLKSIVFVSPPKRAWSVIAEPFGSLRNGDDHKNFGL